MDDQRNNAVIINYLDVSNQQLLYIPLTTVHQVKKERLYIGSQKREDVNI